MNWSQSFLSFLPDGFRQNSVWKVFFQGKQRHHKGAMDQKTGEGQSTRCLFGRLAICLFAFLVIQNPVKTEASGFLSQLDFHSKKGKLLQPVKGLLAKKTDRKQSQKLSSQGIYKGHFYKAQHKEKVHAVAIGRIVFNSFIKGYGQTLIIDHGKHYYSVYGNLTQTFVKKGTLVRAREVIGLLGHKHSQFKTGLYFEIRHFSKPQNPDHWLRSNPLIR